MADDTARSGETPTTCDQAACERTEPCAAERSGWCAHPDAEDGFGKRHEEAADS